MIGIEELDRQFFLKSFTFKKYKTFIANILFKLKMKGCPTAVIEEQIKSLRQQFTQPQNEQFFNVVYHMSCLDNEQEIYMQDRIKGAKKQHFTFDSKLIDDALKVAIPRATTTACTSAEMR